MPFVESSQSMKSRLDRVGVSTPIVAGIVALFIVACVLMVQNLSFVLGEGGFTITQGEAVQDSSGDDGGEEVADSGKGDTSENSEGSSGSASADPKPRDVASEVTVYVSGCVTEPGVYSLGANARVNDAVNAAGGFGEGAATDAVNLARTVADGEQIDIPTEEEVEAGSASGDASGVPLAAGLETPDVASGLVNINTADAMQLQALPGVGEVTAEKIIASREEEGPFQSPEDIKRVSGIGDKKYAEMADRITVG